MAWAVWCKTGANETPGSPCSPRTGESKHPAESGCLWLCRPAPGRSSWNSTPEALGGWCLPRVHPELASSGPGSAPEVHQIRTQILARASAGDRNSCSKLLRRLAEAHGNRTHPRPRNRSRTTVLKTAGDTSPRALPGRSYVTGRRRGRISRRRAGRAAGRRRR